MQEKKGFSSSFWFSSTSLESRSGTAQLHGSYASVTASGTGKQQGSWSRSVGFGKCLERLGGEWVEIQGIHPGWGPRRRAVACKKKVTSFELETTSPESAQRWRPCDPIFCSFTRHTCAYKTFIDVSGLTFPPVMRICLRCFSAHKDTFRKVGKE